MWEWLGWLGAVVAIVGFCWVLSRLMKKAQAGDRRGSGGDSSEPGGFYDRNGGTGV